jgi:hypothetical protein
MLSLASHGPSSGEACDFMVLPITKNLQKDSILIVCLMEIFNFLALFFYLEADKCDG